MSLWSDLRQLRYPRALRISEAEVSDAWIDGVRDLEAQLRNALAAPHAGEDPQDGPHDPAGGTLGDATVADLATGLWRLRQRMLDPGTDRPLESMRRPFRHLESVWDLLSDAGVEIQDHTDAPFDTGMSLKVIAFQPDGAVARERVVETIKPSVYLGRRRIQMGEVIVASPEPSDAAEHNP